MTDHTVIVVLLKVDQGVQKPIFYVSKTLVEVEIRYLPLEKATLRGVRSSVGAGFFQIYYRTDRDRFFFL